MKKYFSLLCVMLMALGACGRNTVGRTGGNGKVIVAYVTSWSSELPDPSLMTHINYAFAHVNSTFDGIRLENPQKLKNIVKLKAQNKALKVLLSIGGWGSTGFSEMASNSKKRAEFAKCCAKIIKEYNIDGIDIDWEYPTSRVAGISASADDTKNFTLLMRDIRSAIGKDKLLTFASISSAHYVNFKDVMQYVDFVNIMSYDMTDKSNPHNSPLYTPKGKTTMSADKAVKAHIKAGIPANKIVLGIPLYGRTSPGRKTVAVKNIDKYSSYSKKWDDETKVPYLANKDGSVFLSYENDKSVEIKCKYIKEQGLRGAMYWEYTADGKKHPLLKIISRHMK